MEINARCAAADAGTTATNLERSSNSGARSRRAAEGISAAAIRASAASAKGTSNWSKASARAIPARYEVWSGVPIAARASSSAEIATDHDLAIRAARAISDTSATANSPAASKRSDKLSAVLSAATTAAIGARARAITAAGTSTCGLKPRISRAAARISRAYAANGARTEPRASVAQTASKANGGKTNRASVVSTASGTSAARAAAA